MKKKVEVAEYKLITKDGFGHEYREQIWKDSKRASNDEEALDWSREKVERLNKGFGGKHERRLVEIQKTAKERWVFEGTDFD